MGYSHFFTNNFLPLSPKAEMSHRWPAKGEEVAEELDSGLISHLRNQGHYY